jgi:hypothetical protein
MILAFQILEGPYFCLGGGLGCVGVAVLQLHRFLLQMTGGGAVVHIEAEAVEDDIVDASTVIRRSICWHSNTVPASSLDSTIRCVFGLPDSVRFMLLDHLGRVVVLDSSIPSESVLTLKVLSPPPGAPVAIEPLFVQPTAPPPRAMSPLAVNNKKRKQPMEYPPESYSPGTRSMQPPPAKHPRSPPKQSVIEPEGQPPQRSEKSSRSKAKKDIPTVSSTNEGHSLFKKLVTNMGTVDSVLHQNVPGVQEGLSDSLWKRLVLPNSSEFPNKRWGAGFASVHDRVYLYGGSSADENFADLWIFENGNFF